MERENLLPLMTLAAAAIFCAMTASAAAADEPPADTSKLLRHVVLFQFKNGTKPADIRGIEKAFHALPGKIDTIRDFEWGIDVSPENRAQGFTHCFLVTFADEAGRDAYLPHAAHQEFVKLLRPHLEKVLVVDYWARR